MAIEYRVELYCTDCGLLTEHLETRTESYTTWQCLTCGGAERRAIIIKPKEQKPRAGHPARVL